MDIGIPREIKKDEYRVGATPEMVQMLVKSGHKVVVETGAAEKIGYPNSAYEAVGAKIVATPAEVWRSQMVIKVKEPQKTEFPLMHEGQILFGYLHLAPDPIQAKNILEKKIVGIAYDTVKDNAGRLPLLIPMSEIAGRMSVQIGSTLLHMHQGGRGVLLGGVPGAASAHVGVVGGGASGAQAAKMALGQGAQVTIFDVDISRLRALDDLYGAAIQTRFSSAMAIEAILPTVDILILTVLIPGKMAPKLITREMLKKMRPGTVIVDISIDQGGCAETSRATTHSDPTFIVDGVVHYCVANMPGACARTATQALSHATARYALAIADHGYKKALKADPGLRMGLNVYHGKVTSREVAEDLGYEYVPAESLL